MVTPEFFKAYPENEITLNTQNKERIKARDAKCITRYIGNSTDADCLRRIRFRQPESGIAR